MRAGLGAGCPRERAGERVPVGRLGDLLPQPAGAALGHLSAAWSAVEAFPPMNDTAPRSSRGTGHR
jgi:hypothetical protein